MKKFLFSKFIGLFLLCLFSISSKAQSAGGAISFEDNTVNGYKGGGSSETAAVNTSNVRTGSKSLAFTTTSTSTNKGWYSINLYATSGTGPNNIHHIYWAKGTVTVDASLRYQTSLPLSDGTGSASNSTPKVS